MLGVLRTLVLLTGLASLPACGEGDDHCATAAALTYNNFGAGFLIENCQSCHASTSTNRQGAPADVHFDDFSSVQQHLDRIRARVLAEPPTMPPGGGIPAADLEKLAAWLDCHGGS